MSRSLKKGPYVHFKLNKKVEKNVQENKKTLVQILDVENEVTNSKMFNQVKKVWGNSKLRRPQKLRQPQK